MNKEKMRGCGEVFRFTFVQSVKSKVYKIACVILSLVAFMVFPAISLINGKSAGKADGDAISNIGSISVAVTDAGEKTGFINAFSEILSFDARFKHIRVEPAKKESAALENELKESSDGNRREVLFEADTEDNSYAVVYGENTGVTKSDANMLAEYISTNMINILGRYYGAAEGTEKYLNPDIEKEFIKITVNGDDSGDESTESGEFTQAQYWVTYAILMIIMLFTAVAGEAVANSIITEKSTRVVEYILVSIKPMALVTGKVLAMLCSVGIQVLAICVSLVLSIFFCHIADSSGGMINVIFDSIKSSGITEHITLTGILAAIITASLGIIFYGFIAGIAGATVSRIEEAAEGLKIFSLILMIGMYIVMAFMGSLASGGDSGILENVAYLLPFSTSFIVPAFVLMGRVGIMTALAAAGILLACIILLLIYVSKVYEYLIYHRGEPIKFRQLIHMSSGRNGGGHEK